MKLLRVYFFSAYLKNVGGPSLHTFVALQTEVTSAVNLWGIHKFDFWLFDTDPDTAFQSDIYPDPTVWYRFIEVMYLKRYFLYSFTWFSLSVGSTVPTQKVFFVEFSLPINFDLLIRVAYESGSLKLTGSATLS
jgi:hypothetical protein